MSSALGRTARRGCRRGRRRHGADRGSRQAAGVIHEVALEGLVVRLVEEVGFPGSLVAQRSEQPRESLTEIRDIDRGIEFVQLTAYGGDGFTQVAVLRPKTAHA